MKLNQFGAVMTFAIELENNLAKFYIIASEKNSEFKNEFKNRAKDAQKRKKKLEKSRRENVTEIILEPIEGLDSKDFELDYNSFNLEDIDKLERIAIDFFEIASVKINVLETKRLLKKFVEKHKVHINKTN